MQIVLNALMAVERVTWTQKEVETLSWSYDVVSLEVSAPRNVRKQEKLKSAIHGRDGLGWVGFVSLSLLMVSCLELQGKDMQKCAFRTLQCEFRVTCLN